LFVSRLYIDRVIEFGKYVKICEVMMKYGIVLKSPYLLVDIFSHACRVLGEPLRVDHAVEEVRLHRDTETKDIQIMHHQSPRHKKRTTT
jgi:hypothetical protein